MSALLQRYKRQATLLERRLDSPLIPDDIRELAMIDAKEWRPMQRNLRQRDEKYATGMQAAFAPFRTLLGPEPPLAAQTDITGGTSITLLWDTPNLSPLPASNVAGSPLAANTVYQCTAWGICTTAITGSQTATLTPIFGTTTGGTSLGASVAAPLEAKVFTNTNFTAQMWVHFRTVGSSGTATCGGFITALPFVGVAAGTAEGTSVTFGTGSATATTVNTTAAQGLALALTPSLATQHWQTLTVVAESLN